MRGILDIFFKVVSVIGHPILLPTYFALTINDIYGLHPIMVVGMTFVFPFLVMLLVFAVSQFKRTNNVHGGEIVLSQEDVAEMSGNMFERLEGFFATTRNRTMALAVVVGFAMLGFFVYKSPMWSLITMLTAIASLGCLLINNFWRLSIHAYGWGFALYLMLFQYSYVFENGFLMTILAILACGMVLASRLYLGRHNNLQVHLGFVIGFAIPALLYLALSF
ncbi:MAG: hypothetical protein IJK62_11910 [Bacteroidales bacterium]|nr:hypothetical protein [Bacteroidales bacterium]MBQ2076387.1 hypothetical protein [Bacteroidales bacterium]MBQ2352297.1 hypothetical protein [Bacteroidales bacterium]MBQ4476189.1 hypothetical protein [Bacteroidales bacterium]MBQ6277394.1 hypothetical protein [Bacteroidales bacterium]